MLRKKRIVNSSDVARRAIFTRRLIRLTRKERKETCENKASDAILHDMAENPHKYAHNYGLRSPKFLLLSYLYKMRGYDMEQEDPGPWDILWSCLGSFVGIFMLMYLDKLIFTGDQLLLIGSFGASSLIIFGAPHSVFAQPRSVVGGQVISAFVGVSVFMVVQDYPMLAAALAVSLAFAAMQITKTMHPPGGATALIAVSGHPVVEQMGYMYTILPVGAGIVILFILALFINNISRNRMYPLRWF